MSAKNLGTGIDEFLQQEGIFDEAQAQAAAEVAAWQRARKGRTEERNGEKDAPRQQEGPERSDSGL